MPHLCLTLILLLTGALLPATSYAAGENLDIRILNAKKLFGDFARGGVPDFYPEDIRQSQAVIIIPNFMKTGFLYAGKYGAGVALARDEQNGTWTAPAFVRVSGGSFGLQAGVQWGEFILIGVDRFDLRDFRGGPTVSGSGSLALGPWGTHTEIGTGWQLSTRTRAFSKSGGLFAALATDGTVFSFDEEANALYYGQGATAHQILSGGVYPTPNGQQLIDEISVFEHSEPRYPVRREPAYTERSYRPAQNQQRWNTSPQTTNARSVAADPPSSPRIADGARTTYPPQNRTTTAVLPEQNISTRNPPRPDYTEYYGKDDLFSTARTGLNDAPARYNTQDYSE